MPWFSIEVLDGASSASLWSEAHGDAIVEVALTRGATDWEWHRLTWGVVLEVAFEDEASWEAFLESAAMTAALDNVPDPISGLIMYKGRGGSSGNLVPRRPRPLIGSGSSELPLPWFRDEDWSQLWTGMLPVGERRTMLGALQ